MKKFVVALKAGSALKEGIHYREVIESPSSSLVAVVRGRTAVLVPKEVCFDSREQAESYLAGTGELRWWVCSHISMEPLIGRGRVVAISPNRFSVEGRPDVSTWHLRVFRRKTEAIRYYRYTLRRQAQFVLDEVRRYQAMAQRFEELLSQPIKLEPVSP